MSDIFTFNARSAEHDKVKETYDLEQEQFEFIMDEIRDFVDSMDFPSNIFRKKKSNKFRRDLRSLSDALDSITTAYTASRPPVGISSISSPLTASGISGSSDCFVVSAGMLAREKLQELYESFNNSEVEPSAHVKSLVAISLRALAVSDRLNKIVDDGHNIDERFGFSERRVETILNELRMIVDGLIHLSDVTSERSVGNALDDRSQIGLLCCAALYSAEREVYLQGCIPLVDSAPVGLEIIYQTDSCSSLIDQSFIAVRPVIQSILNGRSPGVERFQEDHLCIQEKCISCDFGLVIAFGGISLSHGKILRQLEFLDGMINPETATKGDTAGKNTQAGNAGVLWDEVDSLLLKYGDQLAESVRQCQSCKSSTANQKSVLVSGHGIGGAFAQILTLKWLQSGLVNSTDIKCITFGAPLVSAAATVEFDPSGLSSQQDRDRTVDSVFCSYVLGDDYVARVRLRGSMGQGSVDDTLSASESGAKMASMRQGPGPLLGHYSFLRKENRGDSQEGCVLDTACSDAAAVLLHKMSPGASIEMMLADHHIAEYMRFLKVPAPPPASHSLPHSPCTASPQASADEADVAVEARMFRLTSSPESPAQQKAPASGSAVDPDSYSVLGMAANVFGKLNLTKLLWDSPPQDECSSAASTATAEEAEQKGRIEDPEVVSDIKVNADVHTALQLSPGLSNPEECTTLHDGREATHMDGATSENIGFARGTNVAVNCSVSNFEAGLSTAAMDMTSETGGVDKIKVAALESTGVAKLSGTSSLDSNQTQNSSGLGIFSSLSSSNESEEGTARGTSVGILSGFPSWAWLTSVQVDSAAKQGDTSTQDVEANDSVALSAVVEADASATSADAANAAGPANPDGSKVETTPFADDSSDFPQVSAMFQSVGVLVAGAGAEVGLRSTAVVEVDDKGEEAEKHIDEAPLEAAAGNAECQEVAEDGRIDRDGGVGLGQDKVRAKTQGEGEGAAGAARASTGWWPQSLGSLIFGSSGVDSESYSDNHERKEEKQVQVAALSTKP